MDKAYFQALGDIAEASRLMAVVAKNANYSRAAAEVSMDKVPTVQRLATELNRALNAIIMAQMRARDNETRP